MRTRVLVISDKWVDKSLLGLTGIVEDDRDGYMWVYFRSLNVRMWINKEDVTIF